ncbi:MAG: Hsp20/alpha crystallin family protein [Methanosarcinaceae archaeon]|nr:Hsp20/alpha crystallin family protein [Methanosarcinaceae archaeon]
MALVHKNRRNDMAKLHSNMDDLFQEFFGNWPGHEYKLWPAIDIADSEDAVVIKAEVPGCKADDIDISVHGNTLTITGEKRQQEEKKENGYYYSESSYGSFRRELNLPAGVDTSNINAATKDGILTITLPKAEESKPAKIKIKEQ